MISKNPFFSRTFSVFIFLSVFIFKPSYSRTATGYYVTYNNDTVPCRFAIPEIFDSMDLVAIQWKVAAFKADNNKIVVLKPKNIKSYTFTYDYETYTFNSVKNNFSHEQIFPRKLIFIRLIIEDGVKKYSYFFYSGNGSKIGIIKIIQ
jgi:hypothetical protein